MRVVSEQELQDQEQASIDQDAAVGVSLNESTITGLAGYVRNQYWEFRRHRIRQNIHRRILASQRAYNGQYDAQKLAEIKEFGGSDVYARLTAIKCRGATAILRDVYLAGERPWRLEPTPVPDLPGNIVEQVDTLVGSETQTLMQAGEEIDPEVVDQRRQSLLQAALEAVRKKARVQAKEDTDRIDDVLVEGGFYGAFYEFLLDLPIFPYAVLKGPVVELTETIRWEDKQPVREATPRRFWKRVAPMDLYFTPAASSIEEADIIERQWLRRSDLQLLIGVEGYDDDAIKSALAEYIQGHYDNLDDLDSERADEEDKENPHLNNSNYLNILEYHGDIPGKYLKAWNNGRAIKGVKDFQEELDYNCTVWTCGRFTIKAQINPSLRKRHPYYGTSFEKVPGALPGRGLPEIVDDSQHVANAAFRSLVNNLSISSGPQVSINESRMSPTMNTDSLYPWKRWRFTADPMGSTEKPIDFFQPKSNSTELLQVFNSMMSLSDEVSGIPRYMTGDNPTGGAAGTASGLSMLMNNASKVMQQVAAQIDIEILTPLLQELYDNLLMTSDELASQGDDTIRVFGVTMALSKEQDRQRQLEFLQITANPMDAQILGDGRAEILRELAENLGLDGSRVVPSEDDVKRQREQEQAAMQAQQAAQAQGGQAPAPGASDNRPNRGMDNAQRTRSPAAMRQQSNP